MFECSYHLFQKVNLFIVSQNLLSFWTEWSVYVFIHQINFIHRPVNLFKFVAYKFFSLSSWSLVHSYSRWSTVWFAPSHGHSGDSIILDPYNYALVLPWTVKIAVKFGVNLILVVSLSLMIRKNCFVVEHFVVLYNYICHLTMLWSPVCWTISLLGILMKAISLFLTVSFASLSASSFP